MAKMNEAAAAEGGVAADPLFGDPHRLMKAL
jgi:hypothetical protein